MTIEQWGAMGEVIGGIAVVVSLIYVALQLKQTSKTMEGNLETSRLAAFERSVEAANRLREVILVNPDVADLFIRGSANYGSLGPVDRLRFDMALRNLFATAQSAYVRLMSVHDSAEVAESTAVTVDVVLRLPGVRSWLQESEVDWRPEFREFVDRRLASVTAERTPNE